MRPDPQIPLFAPGGAKPGRETPDEKPEKAEPVVFTLRQYARRFFESLRNTRRVKCPCCGRDAIVCKRSLSGTMVRYLAAIYRDGRRTGNPWVDVTGLDIYKSGTQRGDYAYLRHWGLLERKDPEEGEPATGVWKATGEGVSFLLGAYRVPRFCWTYDNQVFSELDDAGFSKESVSVYEAIGKKFDLEELLGWSDPC